MKRLNIPAKYIFLIKDDQGDLWTFKLYYNFGYTVQAFHLQTVEELPRYSSQEMQRLYKEIQKKPPEWWDKALEDYEDEKDKLVLVKKTLKVQCVLPSFCTLRKEDFARFMPKKKAGSK